MLTDEDLKKIGELFDSKLAAQIQPVTKRLDGVDGHLDGIDGHLDSIDGRLNGVDQRLVTVDQRLGKIEKVQRKQGRDITQIKKNLNVVIDYFDRKEVNLSKRVQRIENHLRLSPVK